MCNHTVYVSALEMEKAPFERLLVSYPEAVDRGNRKIRSRSFGQKKAPDAG